LKRTLLLLILAVIPAALMPLAAASQVAPVRGSRSASEGESSYKYEIFAGYGYTSMNQVNQSRYGLQGANLSVTRDWGRFFGLTADGVYYKYPISHPAIQNSGSLTPWVDGVLLGPVLHAPLFGRYDGFFRVLLGAEHTGFTGSPSGTTAYPNLSFAGGIGAGIDYKLSNHFYMRASGDDITSSFVAPIYPAGYGSGCTTTSGCSPNKHRNSRAEFGVVYKF